MNKQTQYLLLTIALLIVVCSIIVTQKFVLIFSAEEHAKIEIWAQATKRLLNEDYSEFTFTIVENNENIPVVIVDGQDNYITSRNFNEPDTKVEEFYKKQIKRLKYKNPPIIIDLDENERQYIYYDDSLVLKQLAWFPFIQFIVIAIFILVTVWFVFATKESEQNKVWVGLTKETAHQLGTPLSSLAAWIEILKSKYPEDTYIPEMSKDIKKMLLVTERFSKIGSQPELKVENVVDLTRESVEYMQMRSSKHIKYSFTTTADCLNAVVSNTLFQWVIENLCKNALDAMDKDGEIDVTILSQSGKIYIDVRDNGKGIEKRRFNEVFIPGYTTKMRGWGLGLSLVKRIVENYHKGKIFVKHSEIGKGTTFRMILPLVEK